MEVPPPFCALDAASRDPVEVDVVGGARDVETRAHKTVLISSFVRSSFSQLHTVCRAFQTRLCRSDAQLSTVYSCQTSVSNLVDASAIADKQ
jgi:hypothetical protein